MKKRGSLYMMGREKNLHKMLRRIFLYIFKKRRMMKIRSNNFIALQEYSVDKSCSYNSFNTKKNCASFLTD